MKTVSIIIPTKNEEKYLPLCLGSISRLDYPKESFEVIVVDNGSTDRTRKIAESFGSLRELHYQFDLASRLGYPDKLDVPESECDLKMVETEKVLGALMRSMRPTNSL